MSEVDRAKRWGLVVLSAENEKQSVRVEILGDSNLSDTLDAIETFLIAAGFDSEQVKKSFA